MASVTLTLKNPETHVSFKKEFTAREWEASNYASLFSARARDASTAFITPLVIPVRVNSAKSFAKDFFLPLTVNFTPKITSVAKQIIFGVLFFILDVATWPFRILTAIPWKLAAPKKEDNPIYKGLLGKNVPVQVLKSERVWIQIIESPATSKEHKEAPEIKRFYCPLQYVPIGTLFPDRK